MDTVTDYAKILNGDILNTIPDYNKILRGDILNTIVIIGGGIAALEAAEAISKNSPASEIVLISDEDYLPYSRIKLSRYLNSAFNIEDLFIHKQQWYEDNNIKFCLSTSAVKIEPELNSITLDNGEKINYSKLILANGSSCIVPPITGANIEGVFTIRKAKDIFLIHDFIKANDIKNITIIGGGLLGIEAAWALKQSSNIFNISIIDNSGRLLSRQLDEEGSSILKDIMVKNGINLYTGVKEIYGNKSVNYIELIDGGKLPSEMVIISAGIKSNTGIAKESGININKGIIVDSKMKTNLDNIYAAGDCAEFNNFIWGIWPVAMEQGKIAGLCSCGFETEYTEIVPSNLLQVMDVNVFSAGDISGKDSEQLKYEDNIYTKLFHKNGILCGAILIGDTKKGFALKKAIEKQTNFSEKIANGNNIMGLL